MSSRVRQPPMRHPPPSAMTWTSTWRADVTRSSMNTVSSPKASWGLRHGRSRALRTEIVRCVDAADAAPPAARRRLDQQRESNGTKPGRSPSSRLVTTWPPLQGATGTPAAAASRFASILLPRLPHDVATRSDEHHAQVAHRGRQTPDPRPRSPSRARRHRRVWPRAPARARRGPDRPLRRRPLASVRRAGPRQYASSA